MQRIKVLIVPILFLSLILANLGSAEVLVAASSPTINSSISIKVKKNTTLGISRNGYTIKKVKATSNDTSIASVKIKGTKVIVTGVSAGKTSVITTITAVKMNTKKTFKLKTKVTVKKEKPVKPSPLPSTTPSIEPTPSLLPSATPSMEPTPSLLPSATPSIEPTPSLLPSATPSVDPTVVPNDGDNDVFQIMNMDMKTGEFTDKTDFVLSAGSICFAVMRSRITPGTIVDGTKSGSANNYINGVKNFSWTIHYADGYSETIDKNNYVDVKNGFVQVVHGMIYLKPMSKFEGAILEYKATVNDIWSEEYGTSTFDLYYQPLHFT